jgi:NADH:ubiquinone oxidoreductase subunit 5 (subunit L)/multisubunit Na+/H+ antiporter MnhA subunit
MNFLFDWISWLFKGFVFIISSLVILYSDDYISGDLSVFRFIILVFIFVVSTKFLNFSPNVVSILLSWDCLGFLFVLSNLLSECEVFWC